MEPVIFPLHPGGGAMFVIERPCCGRESEVSVFANITTGMWQPYKQHRTCQTCRQMWKITDGLFSPVAFSLKEPSDSPTSAGAIPKDSASVTTSSAMALPITKTDR